MAIAEANGKGVMLALRKREVAALLAKHNVPGFDECDPEFEMLLRMGATSKDFESPVIVASLLKHDFGAVKREVRRKLDDGPRDTEQRERSRVIGEGQPAPMPELMTLPEMLVKLVFISDGGQVALRGSPHTLLKLADFKTHSRASVTQHGNRMAPTADLWVASEERITVHTMTFKPSAPEFTSDPNGTPALNLWCPRARVASTGNVQPFLDHVAYLVSNDEERARFLDCLAHLEQHPGVLPHTHYLMVTPQTGIGRNWLASLLARVWPGECRLGLDLMGMLRSGFNGVVARRTLVVVDELRAEMGYMAVTTGQQLKALLTAEERTINPKYGRQHIEFNCARWLMFSQHDDALPLEKYDRRIIVIDNPTERRSPEYYTRLYAMLEDANFVAAVANWLGMRDLQGYNPSLPAPLTPTKQRAIDAGLSDLERCLIHLREASPFDLMPAGELWEYVTNNGIARVSGRAMSSAYKVAGITVCKGMPRLFGKPTRVVALRNGALYATMNATDLGVALRSQNDATNNDCNIER